MREYSWTILGFVISFIFGLLGMIFLIFKEKSCVLISGYNSKTKKEREEYDEVRLSKDERNFFFKCAIVNLSGAILSIFIGAASVWIAFAVWIIYFLKNLHFDAEKTFAKYKKQI
ncbi:DUF3784 domain-containing protein [Inconstantimicrobium mannanitabidum]|uniref:Uncharacterized protein n=1 Tax=Inconstantimicrobium mannanitabidum TaxID=1604901 RepID=A0ACB5RD11_9CLOT|nr:DUF3784 domain-containing protein [Clostridium sp. TW13]GKX67158.1 hypothetical protein rsdtw13_24160 [Clostridium sp. TW13]